MEEHIAGFLQLHSDVCKHSSADRVSGERVIPMDKCVRTTPSVQHRDIFRKKGSNVTVVQISLPNNATL